MKKLLLEVYMQGFTDELDGIKRAELFKRAYNMGRADAIIGDDVSSSDLQSEDDILKRIYGTSRN